MVYSFKFLFSFMSWALVPRGYFHALKSRISSKLGFVRRDIRRGLIVCNPGQALVMSEINPPRRTLSVLGDMQHPDAFGRYKPVAGRGNHLRTIHRRAVDKYDHIGVLLDSSRFPEVGQQRCFIGALLNLARQLRQQDNRNIEFLCEQFCRTAGGSYLPLAGAVRIAGRGVEKLQVVDNDHPAPSPAVHCLTLRAYSPYGDIGPVVEVHRYCRKLRAGLLQL
nr:MAG TPA: hypothetical protein [Caudoviricetes sp.]